MKLITLNSDYIFIRVLDTNRKMRTLPQELIILKYHQVSLYIKKWEIPVTKNTWQIFLETDIVPYLYNKIHNNIQNKNRRFTPICQWFLTKNIYHTLSPILSKRKRPTYRLIGSNWITFLVEKNYCEVIIMTVISPLIYTNPDKDLR